MKCAADELGYLVRLGLFETAEQGNDPVLPSSKVFSIDTCPDTGLAVTHPTPIHSSYMSWSSALKMYFWKV